MEKKHQLQVICVFHECDGSGGADNMNTHHWTVKTVVFQNAKTIHFI